MFVHQGTLLLVKHLGLMLDHISSPNAVSITQKPKINKLQFDYNKKSVYISEQKGILHLIMGLRCI